MGSASNNVRGLLLAISSSIFIGSSFIVKKKGLRKAGLTGVRAGLILLLLFPSYYNLPSRTFITSQWVVGFWGYEYAEGMQNVLHMEQVKWAIYSQYNRWVCFIKWKEMSYESFFFPCAGWGLWLPWDGPLGLIQNTSRSYVVRS